jgi:hypothetical protein
MHLPWEWWRDERAVDDRQPADAVPAPEPSKQRARGSSSRSQAECQAITTVYSLCRRQLPGSPLTRDAAIADRTRLLYFT